MQIDPQLIGGGEPPCVPAHHDSLLDHDQDDSLFCPGPAPEVASENGDGHAARHAGENNDEEGPNGDDDHQLGYNPQLDCDYDSQLEIDRRRNKQKLKKRFEDIFIKYGRDFDKIGDEIDLGTGEIVVDNGHLIRMRHEGDVGNGIGTEEAGAGQIGRTSGATGVYAKGRENAESAVPQRRWRHDDKRTPEPDGQPVDSGHSTGDVNPSAPTSEKRPTLYGTPGQAPRMPWVHPGPEIQHDPPHQIDEPMEDAPDESEPDDLTSSDEEPDEILAQMPELRASMAELQNKAKRGGGVDQETIAALGIDIAGQLTAFIWSRGNGKRRTKRRRKQSAVDPAWQFPSLPARDDESSEELEHSAVPSPVPSPTRGSLWAPAQHPKQSKRKRESRPEKLRLERPRSIERRVDRQGIDERITDEHIQRDQMIDECGNGERRTNQNQDRSPQAIEGECAQVSLLEPSREAATPEEKICTNCGVTSTPNWRNGPHGDLCNACGMYYYRYGLLRPPRRPDAPESGDSDSADEYDEAMNAAVAKVAGLSYKNSRFTLEEDALLIRSKEVDQQTWEETAVSFPGRSAYAVQCRYSKKLHGRPSEARTLLKRQGFQSDHNSEGLEVFVRQRVDFNDEEDELLLKLREEDKLEWDAVTAHFPGRNARAAEHRYESLAKQYLEGRKPKPQKTKRRKTIVNARLGLRYTAEEDMLIIKLREVDKLSWTALAEQFEGRNAISLQKRYVRELNSKPKPYPADPENGTPDVASALQEETASSNAPHHTAGGSTFYETVDGSTMQETVGGSSIHEEVDHGATHEAIGGNAAEERRDGLAIQHTVSEIPVREGMEGNAKEDVEGGDVHRSPANSVAPETEGDMIPQEPPRDNGTGEYTAPFNPEEDWLLLHLRGEQQLSFKEIEERMAGRLKEALEYRHHQLLTESNFHEASIQSTETEFEREDGQRFAPVAQMLQPSSVENHMSAVRTHTASQSASPFRPNAEEDSLVQISTVDPALNPASTAITHGLPLPATQQHVWKHAPTNTLEGVTLIHADVTTHVESKAVEALQQRTHAVKSSPLREQVAVNESDRWVDQHLEHQPPHHFLLPQPQANNAAPSAPSEIPSTSTHAALDQQLGTSAAEQESVPAEQSNRVEPLQAAAVSEAVEMAMPAEPTQGFSGAPVQARKNGKSKSTPRTYTRESGKKQTQRRSTGENSAAQSPASPSALPLHLRKNASWGTMGPRTPLRESSVKGSPQIKSRGSSVAQPRSTKRVVETPVKQIADSDSEDELA